nr:serine/threonine-protein kinase TNNI3K-like [Cherax quadricarinatus]
MAWMKHTLPCVQVGETARDLQQSISEHSTQTIDDPGKGLCQHLNSTTTPFNQLHDKQDCIAEKIDSVRSGDAVKFLQLSATEDAASVLVMQEAGEAGGCTLLGLAAILGHHHLVSPLLSAGVGVDDTGVSTRTPLHQAASYGHEDMTVALLKAGANIEAVSERDNGERALHLACRYGRTNLVKFLLQEVLNLSYRQ